jgi:GT2 family glycosyltransferase
MVLFLDDDIHLVPSALRELEDAWSKFSSYSEEIAGVGFIIAWEDGEMLTRDRASITERWLATSNEPSGTVTAGGLAVPIDDIRSDVPVKVDRLLGGAMCFRRQVLKAVGPLDHLASLYEKRLGRGEDVVLSYYARKHGNLYLLARPLALHPRISAERAPYARNGWSLGLTATWGRAHTLRWTASDWSAYKRAWIRIATLELARCVYGIMRRPQLVSSWKRMGGSVWGILSTLVNWHRIPSSARSTPILGDSTELRSSELVSTS